MKETRKRTLARTMTYRITAWIFTVLLTKAFTGDTGSAALYSTILHVTLGLYYYVHERIWLRVKWGTDEAGSLQGISMGLRRRFELYCSAVKYCFVKAVVEAERGRQKEAMRRT